MTEQLVQLDIVAQPSIETQSVSPEDLANAGNVLAALAIESEVTKVEPTIDDVNEAFRLAEVPLTISVPEVNLLQSLLGSDVFPRALPYDRRAIVAKRIIEADRKISLAQGDTTPLADKPIAHFEKLLRRALVQGRNR
jgi:hypothetical protein